MDYIDLQSEAYIGQYPFEEFEKAEEKYLENLAVLQKEQMQFYDNGFYRAVQCFPKTVDDVYNSNIYSISGFYQDDYPFDKWEEEYETWLYMQTWEKQKQDKVNAYLAWRS